jgi:1,4-alpha-glucan branching enzyme
MLNMATSRHLLDNDNLQLLYEFDDNKIIVFKRADLLFAFNFHPQQSYPDYRIEASPGSYRMLFSSDDPQYGGHGRLEAGQEHLALPKEDPHAKGHFLSLYLPSRTGIVFQHIN